MFWSLGGANDILVDSSNMRRRMLKAVRISATETQSTSSVINTISVVSPSNSRGDQNSATSFKAAATNS